MHLTEDEIGGLNVALNEAEFLGFEVDEEKRIAAGTFNVLTLPKNGPMPDDRRVSIVFSRVGRVAASLRNAHWSDANAQPVPFEISSLLEVVTSFNGLNTYGWEFVDVQAKDQSNWMNRLSLDWTSRDDGNLHSVTLFQDEHDRILDLKVWFDRIEVFDPRQKPIALEAFIEGGKRWWEAFYAGDERTSGLGMYTLKE